MARKQRNAVHGLRGISALMLLIAATLLVSAAQKKGPAGSIFSPDKGRFNILLDGKLLGREEFEVSPNGSGWMAKGTTHLTVEGTPATTVTGTPCPASESASR